MIPVRADVLKQVDLGGEDASHLEDGSRAVMNGQDVRDVVSG